MKFLFLFLFSNIKYLKLLEENLPFINNVHTALSKVQRPTQASGISYGEGNEEPGKWIPFMCDALVLFKHRRFQTRDDNTGTFKNKELFESILARVTTYAEFRKFSKFPADFVHADGKQNTDLMWPDLFYTCTLTDWAAPLTEPNRRRGKAPMKRFNLVVRLFSVVQEGEWMNDIHMYQNTAEINSYVAKIGVSNSIQFNSINILYDKRAGCTKNQISMRLRTVGFTKNQFLSDNEQQDLQEIKFRLRTVGFKQNQIPMWLSAVGFLCD